MKKIFYLLFLIPILSFNTNTDCKELDIVGKWIGEDERQIGSIIFDAEGFAIIEYGGQTIGGKEFISSGKRGSMAYSINFDVAPIQIDFVISMLDFDEQMKMLMIAKFQDKDTMILASNFNSDRPSEFKTDNSITLKRAE